MALEPESIILLMNDDFVSLPVRFGVVKAASRLVGF